LVRVSGCRSAYQEGWSRQDCAESGYEADDSANEDTEQTDKARRKPSSSVYRITFPDSFHFFMDCFLDLMERNRDDESFLYTAGKSTKLLHG
jgi:hypothetical protein